MKPTLRPLLIAVIIVAAVIFSCQKLDIQKIMVIKTKSVSDITGTTANVKGEVVDLGDGMTDYGVFYSTMPNTKNGVKVSLGKSSGTGVFTAPLNGLTMSTKYYVCAFGSKNSTFVYGDEISFTTLGLPALTTSAVTSVTATTASSGGSITSDGGAVVTARGICWSTSPSPTIALATKTTDGSGTGSFTSSITGLITNTTYYVRAYATNSVGTCYGNEVSFKAPDGVVSLTTSAVTSVTATTASSGGSITSDGGAVVTARGICWSTSPSPTIALATKTTDGSGTGSFTSSIAGLIANTTYYVRAYATNSVGTCYGNEVSFKAPDGVVSLTTSAVTSVTATTASSGGSITSDGGAVVTARGICWSTSPSPTIALATKTTDGSGTGKLTSSITGLITNTTYYVRAYATNSVGTCYGNEVSFKAPDGVVSLTTSAVTSVTATTASSGGSITSDGGAVVTARGICWSTSPSPTIALATKTTDGSGTGSFTSSIAGLIANTTYYVRAYATNSVGTCYGNEVSFKAPDGVVSLTTSAVTSVTATTASSGGSITSDGGAVVTARGICWSTSPSPTIALATKTTDGSGTGKLTSSITGLITNTTYYVRAYATNSVGTSYGNEVSFSSALVKFGDTYAGGIVFYIDGTGQHGLVCAPFDQSTAAQWGCKGILISGADGTEVGTGMQNTIDIVNGCSTEVTAARLCYNLVLNGYGDWFLPSRDELNLMYVNLSANGLGGFTIIPYWSSTEYDSNYAWSQGFGLGPQRQDDKNYGGWYVRAVRAF